MQITFATLAIVAALLLGGCGQMGPLYEPESDTPVPVPDNQESGIKP
jgi:predicted small lipoprotein YifL